MLDKDIEKKKSKISSLMKTQKHEVTMKRLQVNLRDEVYEELARMSAERGLNPDPEIYSNRDIQKLSMDVWIETSEGLPPCGLEVIVETSEGFITALVRYKPHEGAPTWRSWWDNKYPGTGENKHNLFAVSRWRKMPEKKHGR